MNTNNIRTQMIVKEQKINILTIDNKEYISLTDLAKYADEDEPRLPIRDWMRNKEVISFLGLWKQSIMKILKGANSLRLKMKLVVINLKCLHKNG